MQVAYFVGLAFCLHQVNARPHPPRHVKSHDLFETEEADVFMRKILGIEVDLSSHLSFSLSFPAGASSKSKTHAKGKAHPSSKEKPEPEVKHSAAKSHRGKMKFTTSPPKKKRTAHPNSKEKPEPKVKQSGAKSHRGQKKNAAASHPQKKQTKGTSLPQPTSLPILVLSPVLTHPPTTTPTNLVSDPSAPPSADPTPAASDNFAPSASITSSTGSSENTSFIPSAGATAGFAVLGVASVLAAALLALHKIAQRGVPYIGLEPYVDDDDPSSLGSGMNSL